MTKRRRRGKRRIHTDQQIEGIRKAASLAAEVREWIFKQLVPGMTTFQVDKLARQRIEEAGATCAFHGYRGFPGHVCISRNDEVVHGVGRRDVILRQEDILTVDVGVKLNGYFGDTAKTVCIGRPEPEIDRLLKSGEESLNAAIKAAVGGDKVRNIGRAVEGTANSYGFSVVKDFVGHGCGCALHEPPEVPNFPADKTTEKLQPGMVICVEPMINTGYGEVAVDKNDGWTVRTNDGSWSAHFEHMLLIRNGKEPEILTWARKQ